MKDTPRSLVEVRKQLGAGALLIAAGVVWFALVLYGGRSDLITPTNEDVQAAYAALSTVANNAHGSWSIETVATLAYKFIVLLAVDILFVVVRYGGLTLCFLGAFAIFDAISNAPRARR